MEFKDKIVMKIALKVVIHVYNPTVPVDIILKTDFEHEILVACIKHYCNVLLHFCE